MLSLLISTSGMAQILSPKQAAPCTSTCSVTNRDWEDWFLIKRSTLKSLYGEAKSAAVLHNSLVDAQKILDDYTKQMNQLQIDAYEQSVLREAAEKQAYELANPPWYKNRVVLFVTGIGIGAVATTALVLTIKLTL